MARTRKVTRPKYRLGDMVYSWQNPTVKREINRINISDDPNYNHKYRLTLVDRDGERHNSKWMDEPSLSKHRR